MTAIEAEASRRRHVHGDPRVRPLSPSVPGRSTETYHNVTAADIASSCRPPSRACSVGDISPTDVVYEHVSQHNQTDWQFLTELADAIGYVVTVVDTALNFERGAGLPRPDRRSAATKRTSRLQLVLGANLLRAPGGRDVGRAGWADHRARLGARTTRRPWWGRPMPATTSASLAIDPAELASVFGSPEFVAVGTPYANQDDVDAAARSVAEQLGGAFAELEGVCRGNPDVRAGVCCRTRARRASVRRQLHGDGDTARVRAES